MNKFLMISGMALYVLWILGLTTSLTLGGAIHILPVIALQLIFIWLSSGDGFKMRNISGKHGEYRERNAFYETRTEKIMGMNASRINYKGERRTRIA
ncbi:MAG: hypothetical protein JW969_00760 [Spirochaetales bacterium]|nr:hypothetical protein [Spirochaetales bacterium]